MAYAEGRTHYDADSHIMELPEFLREFAALGAAEHMAFTPYPCEDVGALIRQSSDTLYLFSSDYPHIEGGRHPLGRFGKILEGVPSASLDRFYCENFARVFGA